MLCRTADSLYWLARYMERADYVARLLQVAGHMSAVRVDDGQSSEWESAIVAAEVREGVETVSEQLLRRACLEVTDDAFRGSVVAE